MGLLGMLGLPDYEDEDWMRKQRDAGAFAPDKPTYLERIGRGFQDVGDALGQGYNNLKVWDPQQAEDFRKQAAEDERLYQKGYSYGHTFGGQPLPENLQGTYPDLWRAGGQVAAITPVWAAAAPGGMAGIQFLARSAGGAASGALMKQSQYMPDLFEHMLKMNRR